MNGGSYESEYGHGLGYDLDAVGNVMEEFERKGLGPSPMRLFAQTYQYDALNRAISATNGEGETREFSYDVRGNLLLAIEPDGTFTSHEYDGLDRLVRRTQPMDIVETFGYDQSSRRTSLTDGRGLTTTWTYDFLGELAAVTWSDSTTERYSYDSVGNLVGILQPTGTAVAQIFDAGNRLIGREITPGPGVGGVTSETYQPDGLGRVEMAASGETAATTRVYDTLSRLQTESLQGTLVGNAYDAANNQIGISYPSGLEIDRHFDRANRPVHIGKGLSMPSPEHWVTYTYSGQSGLSEKNMLGHVGTLLLDEAGRPETVTYPGIFEEALTWNDRSFLIEQRRDDLTGYGSQHRYDAAGRLEHTERFGRDGATTAFTSDASAFDYDYDEAQNLTEITTTLTCGTTTTDLPPDPRNRPASLNGEELLWDANGNLKQKGDRRFVYDFRNRLVQVLDLGGGEIANYEYDASNRRVLRTVTGSAPLRTVWAGWQPIEEYALEGEAGAQLVSRRVYGLGLDEITSLQQFDSTGTFTEYLPFYDTSGNLAQLTTTTGEVVERYEYSPYGERRVWADDEPPTVDQVRVVEGAVWLEFSEPVRAGLATAFSTGASKLIHHRPEGDVEIPVTVSHPHTTGRTAYRRLVITLDEPAAGSDDLRPQPSDSVSLELAADSAIDLFGNPLASSFNQTFTWPTTDTIASTIAYDSAAPDLEQVCVTASGALELQFSEEIATETLSGVLVDGTTSTWQAVGDGYRYLSTTPLAEGSHSLTVAGVTDLEGNPLSAPLSKTFEVTANPAQLVWSAPLPGEAAESLVGNAFGFQGLPVDAETGLIYVRNRYYDPEMGRFISADPLGFVDGPSEYQFALNNPVNYRDPTGEYVETAFDGLSLSIGIWSYNRNLEEGNFGAALGDALGIAVDTFALFTPLPGGVGALRNGKRFWEGYEAARAGTGLMQSVRKAQLVDQSFNIGQGLLQGGQAFGEGNYGWAAFYGGMSALGVRQVAASPYRIWVDGLGNVRIEPNRYLVKRCGLAGSPLKNTPLRQTARGL